VERGIIYQNQTGGEQTLEVDAVTASLGFPSALGPIQQGSLELDGDGIRVTRLLETNLPGAYAADDITRFHGHSSSHEIRARQKAAA
jgi:thioredoxin reductase